jgi:hypothetical protein
MSNPENERYGNNGRTAVEKAGAIFVGGALFVIACELINRYGSFGPEIQGFAGGVVAAFHAIVGFIIGTYHFLHGDLQVRDGAGLVEIFQAISRTQPDWHLNPAVGQPIGNLAERVFRPLSELSR